MTTKQKQVKRAEYKLVKAHTHAGKPLQVGDSVSLRADQAERLRAAGIIE